MKGAAKKLFGILLVVAVLVSVFAVTATAADGEHFTVSGLTYVVTSEEGKTVKLSGAEAGLTSVTIPSTVNGYTVTGIQPGLFDNDTSLQTLTIAENCQINAFGYVFNNCANLKTINWGNSDTLTEIDRSFQGCVALEELTIPNHVRYIGRLSFSNCINLKSLKFAEGSRLEVMKAEAFAYLGKDDATVPATMASLTFPASLETLEKGAFRCIPVKQFALEDGSKLTEIPAGFLSADGDDGKPGVNTEAKTFWEYAVEWAKYVLSYHETPYPFTPAQVAEACNCLVSVDLGDGNSLTQIGEGAFKNQTHLTSIDFGAGSTAPLTISYGAFVAAGNNGYLVEKGADQTLGGIDTLVLPANLVKMEGTAFNYARIKNLKFSDNCQLAAIGDSFLHIGGSNGYPGKVNADGGGYEFRYDAVQIAANSLETVDFGENNSLTKIGAGSFYNQSHLTAIDFGTSSASGLTIGQGAFIGAGNNGYLVDEQIDAEMNAGIQTLKLPANLAVLDYSAFTYANVENLVFSENSRLAEIPSSFMGVIGNGNNGYPGQGWSGYPDYLLSFVYDSAQLAANSLETIDFGKNNSLTKIGGGSFYNQSHLTAIDFGTSSASGLTIGEGAFIGAGNNGYLYQMGIDDSLNAGIETLVLPANLTVMGDHRVGYGGGVFELARIKNLVFSDNCQLQVLHNSFMSVIGIGNNGYPGQEWSGYYPDYQYSFEEDWVQIAANSLETVDFGKNNSLTYIGNGAFYNQSHLTAIDFGTSSASDLTIGHGVFIGAGNNGYLYQMGIDKTLNAGIETVKFPSSLTTLGSGTFGLANIQNIAFDDNCNLSEIPSSFMGVIKEGNNAHPGQALVDDELVFQKDWVQISANSLKTVDFGKNNSLTKIDSGAFYNQSHLTEIDFGTSTVENLSLGNGVFIGAGNNGYLYEQGIDKTLNEGIEKLVLPANLNAMFPGSFDLAKIKNLVFSDGCQLTSIGDGFLQIPGPNNEPRTEPVYAEANSLETVDFGSSGALTSISSGAFTNQSNLVSADFSGSENLTYIGNGAFVGNKSLKKLDLSGTNVTELSGGVFSYSGVTGVVLPNTLTTLHTGAFQNLPDLEVLVIGSDCQLTTLEGGVFSGCESLTTVNLLDSNITTIQDSLKDNPNLTYIVFPEDLETIVWDGTDADICPFSDCGNVNKLRFAAADPSGYAFTAGVFQFLSESGIVYVPTETTDANVEAYKSLLTACGLSFDPGKWVIKVIDAADVAAADAVEDLIDTLPAQSELTLEDKAAVEAVIDAYQSLTEAQQDLLDGDSLLEMMDAEDRIEELEKQKEDQEKADAVESLIEELPAQSEITLEDKDAVLAAYDAYQNLTADQKKLVDQSEVQALMDAVEKIHDLEEAEKEEEDKEDEPIIPVRPVIPSRPATAQKTLPFKDVSKTQWYYDSVRLAWEKGLIDGMTADQFDPNGTLTIAQAIKLAAALYQMDNDGSVTLKNGAQSWYSIYVDYAVANGIIDAKYQSYTDAQTNAAITRSEFAKIFYGAMDNYAAVNHVADNAIPDVKMGDRFATEIYTFYRAGILTGNDAAGTFAPNSNIKRSEVAAILIRMFDKSVRQSVTLQ